jgi:two-component system, LytTR family, sensor kinase
MNGVKKKALIRNLLITLSYYIFWSLVVLVTSMGENSRAFQSLLDYLWQLFYIGLINILLFVFVIPFCHERRVKWIWIILSILPVLTLITAGFYFWNSFGGKLGILERWEEIENRPALIISSAIQIIFALGYHATIYFLLISVQLELQNRQLIIEKKNSELSFLKSQTNPHFLFNTLNNIYSLARTKSDLTAESLLRLSDILRYMLYGAEKERVSVNEEIKIIKEYVELERMRYDSNLEVSLDFEVDDPTTTVPPLMMIHLVENAFKHGVSETIADPFIKIRLNLSQNHLLLEVSNSMKRSLDNGVFKENIGLTNLRRQLSLLFTDYRLDLARDDRSFHVTMTINLDSYAKH